VTSRAPAARGIAVGGALPLLSDSKRVREHLEGLLDDKDPHLKIDVVGAIERLGDLRLRGALRQAMDHELDGRVVRRIREALANMAESGAADRRKLRDELESLRDDLAELKARLSRIESTGKSKGKERAGDKARAASKTRKPASRAKTKRKS